MKLGRGKAVAAYALIDLLGSIGVVVLIAGIWVPALTETKPRCRNIPDCGLNLRQIALSFQMFALDHNDKLPMEVSVGNGGTREWINSGTVWRHFAVMSNELNTPKTLLCPRDLRGSVYQATTFDEVKRPNIVDSIPFNRDRSVSYFVNIDPLGTNSSAWLVGDSDFGIDGKLIGPGLITISTNDLLSWRWPRHYRSGGNIAFADGSVHGLEGNAMRQSLADSGVAITRLAMP